MDTKEKAAKKMLADIRKTVKRLKIKLTPMSFVEWPSPRHAVRCCALGASLALKAKTKKELVTLTDSASNGGYNRSEIAARVLGCSTSAEDMFQLESGFENWSLRDTFDGNLVETDVNHPFYKIGAALREDADKAKR